MTENKNCIFDQLAPRYDVRSTVGRMANASGTTHVPAITATRERLVQHPAALGSMSAAVMGHAVARTNVAVTGAGSGTPATSHHAVG